MSTGSAPMGVGPDERSRDWLTLAIEGVLVAVILGTLIGAVVTALPLMGLLSTIGVVAALVVIVLLVVLAAYLGRSADDEPLESLGDVENF
ncbi:hypothetical protein [Williamsia herbipolensis]|uniref:Uncharacterized protein n=1 Tax=Williamsia herbipolensis TaxID=1603258 RepID=A0AAU4JYM6_9NOCA|nr:hypothetical protein [Williamsia herbipolensis]MCX6469353.1 hypothetical protein [Mycobacteriales bacterium]